ncbi:hypothetical protein GVAMD_0829 [Gardnerella vaginalis AMD]|nr:hypothetical protein GVAMD_0829 [Gardnerella vaginalis AMD]
MRTKKRQKLYNRVQFMRPARAIPAETVQLCTENVEISPKSDSSFTFT